jgi:Polyketide cyclase / dehydrase and lipid transport
MPTLRQGMQKGRRWIEMLRIDTDIMINRPVREVVDYFTNLGKTPIWVYGMKEMRQITEGPIRVGSRFTWIITFLGKTADQTLEITRFEPYKAISYKMINPPSNMIYEYTFEPVLTGTHVMLHVEGDPHIHINVPEPVFASLYRRMFHVNFENLKDLVEAEALVHA